MIISASYRTDIPGFYAPWFQRRYRDGWCLVANPFDQRLRRVPLRGEEVDGYVFWTRNAGPFMSTLAQLHRDGMPFVVHYGLTDYPRRLETHGAATVRALQLCHEIREAFGPAALVWRYDPILLTNLTDADHHRRRFEQLAALLAGATDEVVVSFATLYRKTTTGLKRAAAEGELTWWQPDDRWQHEFLLELRQMAAGHGLRLTVCAQRHLLGGGLTDAACIDPRRLSRVAGRPLTARAKPHRPTCGCAESVDIGAYDTCPAGCVYCYANRSREIADRRRREHRPEDPLLWRPRALRGLGLEQLLARAEGRPDPHREQLTLFELDE